MKSTIATTKKMILDELNKAYENNPTKEIEKKLIHFVEEELKESMYSIMYESKLYRDVKKAGYATLLAFLIVTITAFVSSNDHKLSVAIGLFAGLFVIVLYKPEKKLKVAAGFENYVKIKTLSDNQKEKEAEQRLINEYLTPIKNPQGEDK